MPKPKILTIAKQRSFDEIPRFSKNARIGYVAITTKNRKYINSLRTNVNKVGFLLQWGYFGAKGMFFDKGKLGTRVRDKTKAEKLVGAQSPVNLENYNYETALHHRKIILDAYNWKPFKKEDEIALKSQALLQVDKQRSKEEALFALLGYCWENKIEIQKYNKLATIVNNSYIHYENIIKIKVANNITSEQKNALKKMLDNSELTKQFSKIKRIDQSESQKKLNQNARILDMFKNIFIEVKPLLNKIELTSEAVKHFSDWIYKSDISQIKRIKSKNMLYLRLGTFVQDQFFLRQDYAFDAIIKRLRREYNYAKIHLKGQKDKKENEFHEAGQAVAQTAVDSDAIIKLIQKITSDETMSYAERNEKVQHLVNSYLIAKDPDFENHVTRVMDEISDAKSKLNFYHYLFSVSIKVQKSITPLIKSLKFDKKNSNPSLIKAIEEFVEDKNNPSFEHDFLTDTEIQHIRADDNFSKTSKYKIILFSHIEHAIRTRELTLEYSYRYRANNSYMISDKDWNLNRENHLKVAGLTKFMDGKDVLQSMGKSLSETYDRVNKRYLNGDNEALKVDKNGKWKLKAIEANFDSSKYIPSLLSNSKFKLLYELISEIDSYTKFSEEFSHSSYKHTKKSIDKKLLYATLMSLGNNLGHHDMAKATRGISSKNLNDTDQKWFSADNIKKANQVIVEFIQNLPLPTLFKDRDGVIHTSSDGKKIVVAVESLLANYSYKYYGKEQGISVNSFIDQKQTFFHVNVLTSSDREAPYMMDGIVDTKASLFREGEKQKHIHSSDTHGYTEAIFAGMHFLNVSFAPRIKDVHKQTIYAYEAKSLRKNSNYPIAPNTAINKKLILKNWDGILRLMATIKIGYSSASQLFKILSSSKKDNELYRAMKEFGRLIKSKFILDYIDSKPLRRSIQKQLNRVELGQKLSGAVFFARKGKLHVGTPNEMQKTVACTTLIKNAIILWNYLFLSDYYHSLKSKDEKMFVIDSIVKGSVIAWAHINMHGLYDFDHDFKKSFSATLREMMRIKIYN